MEAPPQWIGDRAITYSITPCDDVATHYDVPWAAGTVWQTGRDYDVLGGPGPYGF